MSKLLKRYGRWECAGVALLLLVVLYVASTGPAACLRYRTDPPYNDTMAGYLTPIDYLPAAVAQPIFDYEIWWLEITNTPQK